MATSNAAFQLRRYYYSDDNTKSNANSWKNITADNLFLVLDGDGNPRGKLTARIVHGTSVLDSIDIAKLIDLAAEARQAAAHNGLTCTVKQLPIYGVTSGTHLAISHRPTGSQIRRMQLALGSAPDCEQIVALFQRRGMLFAEPTRPISSRPGTNNSDVRPRPSDTPASYLPGTSTSHEVTSAFPHSAPSHKSSVLSDQVMSYSFSGRDADMNNDHATLLSRDERNAPREAVLDRPSTSHFFRPHTSESQSQRATQNTTLQTRHTDSTPGFPSDSASWATSGSTYAPRYHDLSLNSNQRSESTPRTSEVRSDLPRYPNGPWFQSEQLGLTSSSERVPSLEMERREGSRPSSALSMPPLPRPILAKPTDTASDLAYSGNSGNEVPVTETGTTLERSRQGSFSRPQPNTGLSTCSNAPYNMPPPARPSSHGTRSSSPNGMNELLYGKRPRTGGSSRLNLVQNDSPTNAANIVCDPSMPISSSHEYLHRQNDETLPFANFQRTAENLINNYGQAELEEYAKLDREERALLLDEFMVKMLGNKGFGLLCEDMDACWQRVSLGM